MIRHIVLTKLKEPTPALLEEAVSRIMQMEGKIEGLLSLEAGINYLDAERNYDLALVACFDTKEHAAAYVNHPVHLPVKKFMHEIRSGSVAIDYEF
ncbi:MAG: Dabb family protein [Clostridia bacterium]|nr:Dabb family protein [Clostridia bacterium]